MLSTVTDEPRWMRDVRPAIAASTTSGAEIAKSAPMMLADAEERQADLVGEHRLLDDVAQHLRVRMRLTGVVHRQVAEGIESKFDVVHHSIIVPARGSV